MSVGKGIHWHCPNRDCNWSIAATGPAEGGAPPRCVCGSVMRRTEVAPVFRYLDFLREETAKEEEAGIEKG